MTVVLGPTWAYEQRDQLVKLGHASVGVGHGTLSHSKRCAESSSLSERTTPPEVVL